LIAVGQRAPQRREAKNLAEQAIRFVVLDRLVTQGDAERAGAAVV
jgi:hypothetical protein